MLYHSEITNQNYKTPEELAEAERDAEKAASKKTATKSVSPSNKRRAELAKAVEEADTALAEAKAALKKAEEQVETLSKDYLEKTRQILTPAQQGVTEAERAKCKAIQAFNNEFGAYVKTITDAEAVRDLIDSLFSMDRYAASPFRFWF